MYIHSPKTTKTKFNPFVETKLLPLRLHTLRSRNSSGFLPVPSATLLMTTPDRRFVFWSICRFVVVAYRSELKAGWRREKSILENTGFSDFARLFYWLNPYADNTSPRTYFLNAIV